MLLSFGQAAPLLAQSQSNAALFTFAIYTLVVLGLAVASSRLQQGTQFLSEYFLGSRNLGMWTFALTFAATSASGGSFTGFPSLIYTHGWVLALWIGSYMLVPAIMMGLLGKRLNQMSRRAGAITIPEVLCTRLASRPLGTLSTVLIIFFMAFNLVAQFKAGAMMLSTLLDEVPLFQAATRWTGQQLVAVPWLESVNPGYLLCLVCFSFAVILYTSYGGFRAVVWTDVLQGVVMVLGVLLLLPMTLSQVGGLPAATRDLAKMVPPQSCEVELSPQATMPDRPASVEVGDWLIGASENGAPRLFRARVRTEVSAAEATRVPALEIRSEHEIQRVLDSAAWQRQQAGASTAARQVASVHDPQPYAFGADQPGVYVTAPGPSASDAMGFLPVGIAVSFFFYWTFSGAGQPSNMVRLMAFNSSATLRRAMMAVTVYFSLIYFPLVVIFCCARILLPGMEVEADRVMPALAEHVTRAAEVPWLAGLLVAAPFAAVMSTVDSFLLMISSAIVRDVYQRDINPAASERSMKRLTYLVTALVGVVALVGAVNPPQYLQNIIVFTGGGLSASFLVPVGLALYWPRFNAPGAIAAMCGGFVTHVAAYAVGYAQFGEFRPLKLGGWDPFVPELLISLVVGVVVCLCTAEPAVQLVQRFFRADDVRGKEEPLIGADER